MKLTAIIIVLAINAICLFPIHNSWAGVFSGFITEKNGKPVSDALVRVQGTAYCSQTDVDGFFSIEAQDRCKSNFITASKQGYYICGKPITTGSEFNIILNPIDFKDNQNYQWLPSVQPSAPVSKPSGVSENSTCQICHPEIVQEWQQDMHSMSAKNPIFLSFFNGTDLLGEKIAEPGYKLDFSNSNGNCATCHLPLMALNKPFNSDPNKAHGVEKEGISCDFCHKINGTRIDESGGYPGILSIELQRPSKDHQLFFGPYDDVFPGEDSYSSLYSKSAYCAPCHHGKFWGILAYSEFQEWKDSSYAQKGIECQDCHMKPSGKMNRFVLKGKGGIERNPATVPSHMNFGIEDEAFMKEAISMDVAASFKNGIVKATISIKNTNAGHHYPTGNPMRNMILLIQASNENGQVLEMVRGEKIPVWGGGGPVEKDNYAGLPGKGFAKILKDIKLYPDRAAQHFKSIYPAPHWRPTIIESDNRIPANSMDTSVFYFRPLTPTDDMVQITTTLIFRRTFKTWANNKKLKLQDLVLAKDDIRIGRNHEKTTNE